MCLGNYVKLCDHLFLLVPTELLAAAKDETQGQTEAHLKNMKSKKKGGMNEYKLTFLFDVSFPFVIRHSFSLSLSLVVDLQRNPTSGGPLDTHTHIHPFHIHFMQGSKEIEKAPSKDSSSCSSSSEGPAADVCVLLHYCRSSSTHVPTRVSSTWSLCSFF